VVARGRVFCLDPAGEKEGLGIVVVISNELHNQFADHLLVALVTDKNVEQIRSSLEVACQLENKKLKILVSHLHAISKETFYQLESYLGKLDEPTMERLNERIRIILGLE
jgi:mRNA-degrading endonuclease toxin of MazEF toxin-antitoxin module